MRYPLWTATCAVLLALCVLAAGAAAPAVAASTCSDSWGSDGHSGPWYTGSNQTLHGNTLVIACPTQSTSWSVKYQVCKSSTDGLCQFTPINVNRTGTGDAQFSVQTGPIGCNVSWLYWTHVHNVVTGGNINKPSDMLNFPCP